MSQNRLQKLYNVLEREFSASEAAFMRGEKNRHELKEEYLAIQKIVAEAKEKLGQYPKAATLKRIGLIETLLKDLLLRYETERRHFNAVGFLLSRLRSNLAQEMLEPRLYEKIRGALLAEDNLKALREKYPGADAVITTPKKPPKKQKSIRLMLISTSGIHYAIPVSKISKKMPAIGPLALKLAGGNFMKTDLPVNGKTASAYNHAVAYKDTRGQNRLVYCDEYFTPVEIPQHMLLKLAEYPITLKNSAAFQTRVRFYGRHFFLYGARLSYRVRPGGRTHSNDPGETRPPQR